MQKQSKFSSSPILSGCQTYDYLNVCSGRMLGFGSTAFTLASKVQALALRVEALVLALKTSLHLWWPWGVTFTIHCSWSDLSTSNSQRTRVRTRIHPFSSVTGRASRFSVRQSPRSGPVRQRPQLIVYGRSTSTEIYGLFWRRRGTPNYGYVAARSPDRWLIKRRYWRRRRVFDWLRK